MVYRHCMEFRSKAESDQSAGRALDVAVDVSISTVFANTTCFEQKPLGYIIRSSCHAFLP